MTHPHHPAGSRRPLLLVDIDGVLNIFGARRVTSHQRFTVIDGYPIVLDQRHPAWFTQLEKYADLCWATMWQAKAAPVFGEAAGIGTHWPHLDFDSAWSRTANQRTGRTVGGYKWPLIEPLGETDRPLLWIDDDMTDDHLAWAHTRHADGRPTLFVRPDPAQGFTVEQFGQVLTFVRQHATEDGQSTTSLAA